MSHIKFMHSLTHLLTSIRFLDLQKKLNITNTMPLVQNSTWTKQTSIIGPHDSHSQFLLLPYNRLTPTVLSPYSMTLAYHDQNKLQHKQNTWLINLFHLLDVSSSSLCNLQNQSSTTNYHIFSHNSFFSNQMHAQQNWHNTWLTFCSPHHLLYFFSFVMLQQKHYNQLSTTQ